MKYKLHIPTVEYGFIELEGEVESAEQAVIGFGDVLKMYRGADGLKEPEFQKVLDNYLYGTEDMEADQYAGMNKEQIGIIQTIKRSKARLKNKNK